jgi:hypothetical protein
VTTFATTPILQWIRPTLAQEPSPEDTSTKEPSHAVSG